MARSVRSLAMPTRRQPRPESRIAECILAGAGGSSTVAAVSEQPLAQTDSREREGNRDGQQAECVFVLAQLNRLVDCQRERGCPTWDVSSDHDRGAEFAQGACECE